MVKDVLEGSIRGSKAFRNYRYLEIDLDGAEIFKLEKKVTKWCSRESNGCPLCRQAWRGRVEAPKTVRKTSPNPEAKGYGADVGFWQQGW